MSCFVILTCWTVVIRRMGGSGPLGSIWSNAAIAEAGVVQSHWGFPTPCHGVRCPSRHRDVLSMSDHPFPT